MYDAALFYKEKAQKPSFSEELAIQGGDFVLCTIHRAENTDNQHRLSNIFQGLGHSDELIILPIHPRTKAKLLDFKISVPENIRMVDPVGYLEMVWLEANCRCVATDSGGVQKEAYFHEKRCVTLRKETEWIELLTHGVNDLVDADEKLIADALRNQESRSFSKGIYGSGNAGEVLTRLIHQ